MKNAEVARILDEIADLLDLQGVAFKPRAYRRAAQAVSSSTTPIEDLAAAGRLETLPGVGDAIAGKIAEIVETGHLTYHEELKAALPVDLFALTQVEGVGPKTAKLLYETLGIRTLSDLEEAARAGRIETVKGLGKKTQERILRGLAETRRVERRLLIGHALPLAEDLCRRLKARGPFDRLVPAGSLRRGRETIGDLDLLAISGDPRAAADAFVEMPDVQEVLAHGEKKSSVTLSGGPQVDLRIVAEPSFGAALQYFTGSKAHNIALRKRAVARGLKLNEYGLFDGADRCVAGRTETEIYQALGLPFIPPELREDEGEIAAAEKGTLPDLLTHEAIRGDLHVHTDWSDGKATLSEMVDAARTAGLSYIAITDHARFAEVVGGLRPADLERQIEAIEALNETLEDFRVLTGVEANIGPDGSLDVADRLLRRLDVVIAAVHSQFRQSREAMTKRLVRAVEHEAVRVLAHPTGRKIGERAGIDADWHAIFHAAAQSGTALECNANPIRLDLPSELARRAIGAGVRLTVGTDAHHPDHFAFLRLGVLTLRRGWARADDVLNTESADRLMPGGT